MTSVMRQIAGAMAKVDPNQAKKKLAGFKPDRKMQVVGKASDELLRLWGVVAEQEEAIAAHVKRGLEMIASPEPTKEEKRAFLEMGEKIDDRLDLLRALFWASVQEDFPEVGRKTLGIVADGQIVCWKPDPEPGPSVQVIDLSGLMDLLAERRAKSSNLN